MKIDIKSLEQSFVSLASIDSPTFFESKAANYVKSSLDKIEIVYKIDTAGEKLGGNQGNIYAFIEGSQEKEPRLFSAHLDTVSPCKNKKIVCGSKICSDGTTILGADNCSAVVSILKAIEIIKKEKIPHGPIELLFTVAEEVYCLGAKAIDYNQIKSKIAFVPDIDSLINQAVNKAPTIISFKARLIGKAAHAGFKPQNGVSAINGAAAVIARLKTGIVDEETRVNIGTIIGGVATNIVAPECTVEGEIRSLSHHKAAKMLSLIKEEFESQCPCQFTSRICMKAYETPENSKAAIIHKKALEKMGFKSQLIPTFGGSDLNEFAQRGIKGLVISGAMHDCHSLKEYTTIKELEQLTQLIIELMTQ